MKIGENKLNIEELNMFDEHISRLSEIRESMKNHINIIFD